MAKASTALAHRTMVLRSVPRLLSRIGFSVAANIWQPVFAFSDRATSKGEER